MTPPNVKDLLLAPRLDPEQVISLLGPYGFKEPARADANLQAMAEDAPARLSLADILEELLDNVSRSADPDQAMNYFERFARAAVNKIHFFSYLKDSPRTLEILAKTFGGSPYMAEILIRDPHYLYWVTDPQIIHNIWGSRKKREIEREFLRSLKSIADERKRLDYLRVLKRRETLRIGVRDLLRLCSIEETLTDLSNLAETLISAAHWICSSALRREYGIPGKAFGGFTILAMGKLGGGELNFSSDVDLIYLYASDQEEVTEGAATISASEYFRRLCQKITLALSEFTGEGYVYRVDLRLRPEGKAGNIAYSLDGFDRYYQSRGETWERLALLKAWPVAGDRALGMRFLEMARPFIYDRPFDLKALEEVRGIKRKIDQQISIRQQGRQQRSHNVKLGAGGIREIELIIQALQVCHGPRTPQIRERNTLKALGALRDQSLISTEEYETLTRSYVFLRDVENKLQMVNDAQTHSLPIEGQELTACARRLGYSGNELGAAAEQFLRDYLRHTSQVNSIFEGIFSSTEPGRFHQLTC
jgi:[glutamine synthetase] adenylyltransferase / [glutamine synthetase]-adenylyl-L-tyrosine phosphorylase